MPRWDERLDDLGIRLDELPPSRALYASVVVDGTTAFTSGTVGITGPPYELAHPGRVGDDLSLDEGRLSAQAAMHRTLSNLRTGLGGSLDGVDRFLKVTGYIRCTPDVTDVSKVMDGASEVLDEIFGEDRRSARSAIGVAALPHGASVEIEAIVRLVG